MDTFGAYQADPCQPQITGMCMNSREIVKSKQERTPKKKATVRTGTVESYRQQRLNNGFLGVPAQLGLF